MTDGLQSEGRIPSAPQPGREWFGAPGVSLIIRESAAGGRIRMDEKQVQKRLKKTVKYAVLTVVVLLITARFLVLFLNSTVRRTVDEQMRNETDEYVRRVNKQVSADLQLLETVASLLGDSGITESDGFSEIMEHAYEQNDFLTMGYFSASGDGVVVSVDGAQAMMLDENQTEIQSVASEAFGGKTVISDLFWSSLTDETVFVYGIPVIENGEVRGALCASDHVEIFTDILNGKRVMGGSGRIHMLSQNGDFLIRFGEAVVREKPVSIFESPYLQEYECAEIQRKMQENQETWFSFRYDRKTYRAFLEPVGINGWYLFCVNSVDESSALMLFTVKVTGCIFAGVLAIIALWLVFAQRVVRKNTRELQELAYYDTLTGANNFSYFRQLAGERMRETANCTIVSLNIHQFKFLNEMFGKERADKLLCHVADTIKSSLKYDELFCRESADYFYLFLRDTGREQIRKRLEKIMEKSAQYSADSREGYHVFLYCGAVISSKDEVVYTLDQMMTHVMFALAKAHETHQNNVWFFDTKLHEKEKMDNYVEGHMYQALENEEFLLYLQPKIDLRTGGIGSAEALVRWQKKDGSMIYPGEFIPVFENNGFCTKLDIYMVEKVCRCIRDWIDSGFDPIPISVNQSKAVLFEKDYIGRIEAAVRKYNISPKLITLEILEGAALENAEELNEKIQILKEDGFCISMDDFGSGYSSLNTLSRINISELKLDRAFLKEAAEDQNGKSKVILEQITKMAQKLHIRTVVEGVETEENDRMIRELGCDYGQGYYYGRPVSAEEFTEKLYGTKGVL